MEFGLDSAAIILIEICIIFFDQLEFLIDDDWPIRGLENVESFNPKSVGEGSADMFNNDQGDEWKFLISERFKDPL